MKRLFTKRMIGIHFAGIASIIVCILLSQWQWSRAHVVDAGSSAARTGDFFTLSPRLEFLPVGSIGVTTTVSGNWMDDKTFTMRNRSADGSSLLEKQPSSTSCDWVVTPLQLTDNSVIAVVRGCIPPGGNPAPVTGQMSVTGVLQPSEGSDVLKLSPGIEPLTTELVVSQSDSSAHDGYLVMDQPTTGLTKVQPILSATPKVPLHWRNVFYTFNWLFFALVILAMWVRVVKDELTDSDKDTEEYGKS